MSNHNEIHELAIRLTRRHFFQRNSLGLGTAAMAALLPELAGAVPADTTPAPGGVLDGFHHPPKARRVIYLFMSGGPS